MGAINESIKRCSTCLFNTLCVEKKQCPILEASSFNNADLKEELQQFSKIKFLRNAEETMSTIESFLEARARFIKSYR